MSLLGRRNHLGPSLAEAASPSPSVLSPGLGERAGEEEGLESEGNILSSRAKSPETFQLLEYRFDLQ